MNMNKKDVLVSQFNHCLSSDYDESPVDISQNEVDMLMNKEQVLDIQKTEINKETTLLTFGNISALPFPFKR